MFAPSLDELADELRELEAGMAAWLANLAEYDRSGQWATDGFVNPAAALRHNCNIDQGVAHRHLQLARKLRHLPLVAAAFAAGEISERHATVVATAYTTERADEINRAEAEFVTVAREHTPKALGAIVRYLTDAIDGDGGAAADERSHARRECFVSETLDGAYDLRANLDPVGGKLVETALDAEMRRDLQPHDSRSTPQRRADALVALARLALERGELGESHNIRPHLTYVVETGPTPATVAGEHLRAVTRAWLSCDCTISRVLVSGRSEIIDVGRATRTVSAPQWKALVVRDRHCQAPGCDRPPERCDAHHIHHWEDGGRTDLANLQLLCWSHHRQRHIEEAKARAANRDP